VELDGRLLRVLNVKDSEGDSLLDMHGRWFGRSDITSEGLETIDAMHVALKRETCFLDKTY
jgi:hypothetical protein